MINSFYLEELGKFVGKIIELDVDKDGLGWGPYLCIKVWVDISKPLIRGRLMNFAGNQFWLAFKYERLSNFCFKCSIIRHPRTSCSKGLTANKIHENDQHNNMVLGL